MKRFQFRLDTVLGYRQQVLDALQAEHGAIQAQIRQQEALLRQTEARYCAFNEEFREKKAVGITVADARACEMGLRVLERDIRQEMKKLESLHRQEEAKRAEVVLAKQETSAVEKLREHQLDDYNKAAQKSEEAFIEELVSAARVAASIR